MQNPFGNQEAFYRKVLVLSFFLSRRPLVQKTVFDLRQVNVRFMLNHGEKGEDQSLSTSVSRVGAILPMLRTLLHPHVDLTKRTKSMIFQKPGSIGLKNAFIQTFSGRHKRTNIQPIREEKTTLSLYVALSYTEYKLTCFQPYKSQRLL